MTQLLELQDQLRDTTAAIARFESLIAVDSSPSIAATLRSLQNRLANLEADYLEATKQVGVDVCSYRLFSEVVTRPAVSSIFAALNDFQRLYTTVYDSIRNGPRKKSAATPEMVEQSTFKFGYSFAGSVGIVMTFDNKQEFLQSELDQAMDAVFDLARSKTTEQVLVNTDQLGHAAIRAMHTWASDHIHAHLGADITWLHGREVKAKLLLQLPELVQLVEVLTEASQQREETVQISGVLVGVETESSRRFHFRPDDGEDFRGSFAPDVVSEAHPRLTPARYQGTFKKTFTQIVSTGEERDVQYTLTALKQL